MIDTVAIAVSDNEVVDGTMIVIDTVIVAETVIVGGHVNGEDHVRGHLAIDQGAMVRQNLTFMVATRIGFIVNLKCVIFKIRNS